MGLSPAKLAEMDKVVSWVMDMPSKGEATTKPGVLTNDGEGVGTADDVAETVPVVVLGRGVALD